MRILLVVKTKVMENLGVMYLSSVIQRAGHECRIVSLPEMVSFAHQWKPDIIGLSIMTGDQKKFRYQVALLHRNKKWNPKIILGGPHVTFFPDDCTWADMIIPGEAENEISELLGSNHRYPDLDSIPWPERGDFPYMKIRDFVSSRGCPFNCSYCFNDQWNKLFPDLGKVRTRSVKDVVNEIATVRPQFAYFQDSCFAVSMRWMLDFADLYPRKAGGIPYHCHLRPDQVTEDRARLLAKSGCYSTRIALETASDRLRQLINRPHSTNEQTYEAAANLKRYGIKLMIQNILCLPTSTLDEDLATLEANIIAQPDYAWCSIFVPYPGTVLGNLCVEEGWYNGDYEDITDSFFDQSVLNISEQYREQTYYLQKCFALCVKAQEIPKPEELTYDLFPFLIHRLMRKMGDKILYGGII